MKKLYIARLLNDLFEADPREAFEGGNDVQCRYCEIWAKDGISPELMSHTESCAWFKVFKMQKELQHCIEKEAGESL